MFQRDARTSPYPPSTSSGRQDSTNALDQRHLLDPYSFPTETQRSLGGSVSSSFGSSTTWGPPQMLGAQPSGGAGTPSPSSFNITGAAFPVRPRLGGDDVPYAALRQASAPQVPYASSVSGRSSASGLGSFTAPFVARPGAQSSFSDTLYQQGSAAGLYTNVPIGGQSRASYSPAEAGPSGIGMSSPYSDARTSSLRKPSNRDEFDGPHQLLDRPPDVGREAMEDDLPELPVSLYAHEQDQILAQVNDRLSQCAFDFVARYQFPIPLEQGKRPVRVPQDREWTEWVYLLKRLATKRRIPARVLYHQQIKQFTTILDSSLEMRHAAKHQSRPLKDDRNVLQLISAGTQVAKILKDSAAMEFLDGLYIETEQKILERKQRVHFGQSEHPV